VRTRESIKRPRVALLVLAAVLAVAFTLAASSATLASDLDEPMLIQPSSVGKPQAASPPGGDLVDMDTGTVLYSRN
jgi:hypothetical protein